MELFWLGVKHLKKTPHPAHNEHGKIINTASDSLTSSASCLIKHTHLLSPFSPALQMGQRWGCRLCHLPEVMQPAWMGRARPEKNLSKGRATPQLCGVEEAALELDITARLQKPSLAELGVLPGTLELGRLLSAS